MKVELNEQTKRAIMALLDFAKSQGVRKLTIPAFEVAWQIDPSTPGTKTAGPVHRPVPPKASDPGLYTVTFGKWKGWQLNEIEPKELDDYIRNFLLRDSKREDLSEGAKELVAKAEAYFERVGWP